MSEVEYTSIFNKDDVLYTIQISAMLTCEDTAVVPSLIIQFQSKDAIAATDFVKNAINVLDKSIDFKDGPYSGLRPMTPEEVEQWERDQDGPDDMRDVIKPET